MRKAVLWLVVCLAVSACGEEEKPEKAEGGEFATAAESGEVALYCASVEDSRAPAPEGETDKQRLDRISGKCDGANPDGAPRVQKFTLESFPGAASNGTEYDFSVSVQRSFYNPTGKRVKLVWEQYTSFKSPKDSGHNFRNTIDDSAELGGITDSHGSGGTIRTSEPGDHLIRWTWYLADGYPEQKALVGQIEIGFTLE